jgi:hypothetical protein
MASRSRFPMDFPFPFPARCKGDAGNAGRERLPAGEEVAGGRAADTAFADEVGEGPADRRGADAARALDLGHGERRGRVGEGPRDAVLGGGERARRLGVRLPVDHAERERVDVRRIGRRCAAGRYPLRGDLDGRALRRRAVYRSPAERGESFQSRVSAGLRRKSAVRTSLNRARSISSRTTCSSMRWRVWTSMDPLPGRAL